MAARKTQDDVSKARQRQKLEEDTQAFLESGGKISVIPTGQSGVDLKTPGQKHIKLGKNN